MAPALVRFYGGSPKDWKALTWNDACLFYTSIPRLLARESGELPADIPGDSDFAALLDQVKATAATIGVPSQAVTKKPEPQKAKSVEELQQIMGRMGIGVEAA